MIKITIDVKKIIKERRIELGLTMADVAKAVGVSEATVSRWESGDIKNMKRSRIASLSDVLKISPIVLMGMSEDDFETKLSKFTKQYQELQKISNPLTPLERVKKSIQIPLLGTIAAGAPLLAEENIEDYFHMDIKVKADFALRIKGDSMINAGILEGDIVFIRKQECLENGEIGAVQIEEMETEATLKRIYMDSNSITLQSENPKYPPKVFTDGNIKILGKLVAVLNIRE